MTVSNTSSRVQYVATSGQTVFAYPFEIIESGDIAVKINGTLTTAYTLSGVGVDAGGNVTLNTGATLNDVVTIYRDMSYSRTTDYQNSGDFLADTVDADIDRVVLQNQQTKELADRAIRPTIDDTVLNNTNTELAAPATRAGKLLGFTSSGALDYISGSAAANTGSFREYSTMAAAVVDIANITIGDTIFIQERSTGSGGASFWNVVDATTVTENEYDIVTGDATRSLQIIVGSTLDGAAIGMVGGATDDKAALDAALSLMSAGGVITIPFSEWTLSSFDHNQNVEIRGIGRINCVLTITGFDTDPDTSSKYAYRLIGDSVTDGLAAEPKLTGMEIRPTSTEAALNGILVRRKSTCDDVYVNGQDTLEGDAWRFDTDTSNNATFFGRFTNCWGKFAKGYGCNLREGANANIFYNCQFDSNGLDGFIHQVDGTPINGNIVIGGQASFNDLRGYNIDSGTNFTLTGTYAEFNSAGASTTDWATSTAYTAGDLVVSPSSGSGDADTDTIYECASNHTSGTYATDFDNSLWDVYGQEARVGQNVTFSKIQFGLILGSKPDRVLNEHTDTSTEVSIGGKLIGRRYDNIRMDVGAGGEVAIYFNEADTDIFRIRYDGAPSNPDNELLIESQNGGTWTEVVKLTNNGRISFFGSTTQAQQDITGSRGGNAALANLLTALANLGIITDSTT